MSPMDVLRANIEAEIGREIIRLVPHWYEAECGPERYAIPICEHTAYFHNHCRLTPILSAFLSRVIARTKTVALEYFIQFPSLVDVLLESFAIDWLRMHNDAIDWARLIKYLETVARRTYENQPVSLNLILRAGSGIGDVTRPKLQKFFDQLASSPLSYLAVDYDLRLMHYGEVEMSQALRTASHRFYPEFLHPTHTLMDPGDLSAHLTAQGDIIIMNKSGLLAARRKRKWKIYDVRTFKNALAYCLGNFDVGANLFEVVFNLSFRRQGGLLIYDPDHRIQDHILNPESILCGDPKRNGEPPADADSGQSVIARSIADIAIGKRAGSMRWKRRLVEMACIDGAVVFDEHRLLAVGALIRSSPSVGNQLGARTTAARSAYLWGAHPIKISSDGDVSIFFTSRKDDRQCDAVMNFL